MIDIECRTAGTHIPAKATGLDVECSLERGLVCKSSSNQKTCPDFEIRVLCDCGKFMLSENKSILVKSTLHQKCLRLITRVYFICSYEIGFMFEDSS